ncbi:MAG: rod shape-determining protein MreC [Nitrospirota bacterium]
MYHFLAGHKRLLLLLLVIFSAFLWMTYQVRTGDRPSLTGLSDSLLSFPQKMISLVTTKITGIWDHYIFLAGKAEENERLRGEVERLKSDANRYKDVLDENRRLKNLLSLKEAQPAYVATVRIIGRDVSSWFRTILVDKGELDGLKKDMAAITPSGLVGRVYHVMPRTARVLLITDRGSSLAVRVQRTRDEGILEGTGENICRLKYMRQSTELKEGDVLLSSGLDGVFPSGLTVGTISRVERKGPGFFQEVDVTPATDVIRLDEVIIVGKR